MRLLLDTHTLIWFLEDAVQLSAHASSLISSEDNDCFVSAGSIWEMAVKVRLSKLKLPYSLDEKLPQLLEENFLGLLPVTHAHAAGVAKLPLHHRDPFDRLLVSVARHEKLALVSCDAVLDEYGIKRIW